MTELVVLSNRVGAGKTTLVASLAELMSPCVTVDCDLHAGNLALLSPGSDICLGQVPLRGFAQVDSALCTACGKCESACRFGAIRSVNRFPVFNERRCDGCFACSVACHPAAIYREQRHGGSLLHRRTTAGSLVHIHPVVQHDSCELVVDLLRTAGRKLALDTASCTTLINAAPGAGCAAFAALAGADTVLIITEPSAMMVHEVRQMLLLVSSLRLRAGVVINKCDLWESGALEVGVVATSFGAELVIALPYSERVPELLAQARLPIDLGGDYVTGLESIAAWVGQRGASAERLPPHAALRNYSSPTP